MGFRLLHAAVAVGLLTGMSAAAAQQAPPAQETDLRKVPDLGLSAAQKLTIYTSISNLPAKETAPPTFRAAVGEVVPDSIKLQPLPKTIVELIPQIKDYEYALVANQVLLVHPQRKNIVEIISQ
jgi:hypothetical protein